MEGRERNTARPESGLREEKERLCGLTSVPRVGACFELALDSGTRVGKNVAGRPQRHLPAVESHETVGQGFGETRTKVEQNASA